MTPANIDIEATTVNANSAATRDRRILLGIAVVLGVVVTGLMVHTARQADLLVQRTAIGNAAMYSDALTEFRTLYTDDVVNRARDAGLQVRHDYHEHADAIPLPATMSMELGKRIGGRFEGAVTRLYSDAPFPWQVDGGARDDFEREALLALRDDPGEPYFRFEQFNERPVLRYATADLMRTSCVSCHNSHPDSPKRDWVVGDVRGVLEVVLPLDGAMAQANSNLATTMGLLIVLSLLAIGGLAIVSRSQRRDAREIAAANCELASANEDLKRKSDRLTVLLGWLNEQNTVVTEAREETEKRTAELEAARRAAVNMMQDADHMRRQAEAAERERAKQAGQLEKFNAELQNEIAERRRADARMRAIMQSSLDCIISMDQDGNVLEFNPAAEQVFGYRYEDVVGHKLADLIVPPEFRAKHTDGVETFLASGEGPVLNQRIEITAMRSDGSEFPAEVAIVPTKTDRGYLFTGYLRDISEVKQAERDREEFQRKLAESARQAGMAEIATGVLHNVGNVLNSVNISANIVTDIVKGSRAISLAKAAELLSDQQDLGDFFLNDDRGQQFPHYLGKLSSRLHSERQQTLDELGSLMRHIDHVKQIIGTQQSYARVGGTVEATSAVELLTDALTIHQSSLTQHGVEIVRDFRTSGSLVTDRHRVLQVLINLISNAKGALCAAPSHDKRLTLTVTADDSRVRIDVADNGIGIPGDNLTKIFAHGFTTKKDGHGFGLHASALAATELGGSLSVHSDGADCGATFTLQLPIEHEEESPCTARPPANAAS